MVYNGMNGRPFPNGTKQLFSIITSKNLYGVQTILGAPVALLGDSCGFHDSLPPQEAKVSIRGI